MAERAGELKTEEGEAREPVFLTKSAAALYSGLGAALRAGRLAGLTRRRLLPGLAGGGAAALAGPVLEAMPAGLRYGRWGARLDGMVDPDAGAFREPGDAGAKAAARRPG